jgi:ABC-2 type transport system ATP-binding protein
LFLNSHLLSETERVCDRIGILAGGRLVREGALLDLCGSETAYRARFAPGHPADLPDLGFRPTDVDSVYRIEAPDPAALNDCLDAARRKGALLIELSRDLRDLEDVLAEALRPAGGQSATPSLPEAP